MSDIEQGSEEWFAARRGKATASKIADIVAKTKTGYSASRANYMAQIIAERLTGTSAESYTNAAMQWGKDTEAQAIAAYSFETDRPVRAVGFVDHPIISMTGASPDGYVLDNGLIEVKCPNTATHIDTLLGASIEGKYIKQMQWQMACTSASWCDFVSFDPRLPIELQLKIQRVQRDDALIAELEKEVSLFLQEVDDKLAALKALMNPEVPDKFKVITV